ncbi:hypothetical protein NpPPO83_00011854, partial [Neofusicoccum parvum]
MRLPLLLSFFFTLLALVYAASDLQKAQFEIARKAYAEATGGDLRDEGERKIAFVEKWHNGKSAMDCAAGFTHYLLIVADIKKEGAGRDMEWSLDNSLAVHLGKADPGKIFNTPATVIVSKWVTDTMRGNTYQWKGWVKDTASEDYLKDQ